MKKNVGMVDAIIRITCGFTGLAWAISRMVRMPYQSMPMIMAVLSSMKIAEGITRYCPLLGVFGVDTLSEYEKGAGAHTNHCVQQSSKEYDHLDPSI